MLSPDARKLLMYAKSHDGKVNYHMMETNFLWDFDKAKSVCQMLVDEKFAIWAYTHIIPGKEIIDGISLSEKGRYSRRFSWSSVGYWLLDNLIAILALIVAIISLLMQST